MSLTTKGTVASLKIFIVDDPLTKCSGNSRLTLRIFKDKVKIKITPFWIP